MCKLLSARMAHHTSVIAHLNTSHKERVTENTKYLSVVI